MLHVLPGISARERYIHAAARPTCGVARAPDSFTLDARQRYEPYMYNISADRWPSSNQLMPSKELSQLQPTYLREQARAAIQARIVTGGVEVGVIYPVAHFSSQLGVSATPVREALFDLAHDGLVELVRNRGFRVRELSEHDLDEIFELRLMLEVPAIGEAAGRLTPEDVSECAGHAKATEDYAANGDLVGFLAADREFHLRMLAPLANSRLVQLIARLRDQARLPGLQSLAEAGTLTASAEEHFRILKAVELGDADEARVRMRRHLQHTRGIWAGRGEIENST